MNHDELVESMEAVKQQVEKSRAEIVSAVGVLTDRVAELEDIINNLPSGDVPQAVVDKFEEVKAAVQAVDDLNPDA